MRFNLEARAKINLGLNVVGKLENGYHLLDMVMVPISLSDKLTVEFYEEIGELEITTNKAEIPTGKSNILYKIYDKFYEITGLEKRRITVYLEKNIPHEAGLGGGSSDGAIFLKTLNSYHKEILNESQLIDLGKSIGADIPFFIKDCACRVQGIGEILEEVENNLDYRVVVIKPNFGVSTAVAYGNMKKLSNMKKADIDKILKGLRKNSLDMVKMGIENNLEEALLIDNMDIISFRKKLAEFQELMFFMSGSGSAYFTFIERDKAELCLDELKKRLENCEVHLCDF
ncbi:MAG: 4-(cytidine 5'-diphospho)-2-C-methyl-D-erythritol kinase [Cetobacterium sp.]|uniref:4-(cytidine 5'-diphospho)-2-C-methyl-D-erythritol kinase n=1 Tax=unclassified Cetobacterium TaxID=2630983 RepID=UPI00163BFC77|nr:4-(cytidine 5'-diphospho)-2-C-methyl-D-erythritol kinase [Cetobacterium sp. 2A]MBC2856208.1 4-(cytidine 5'-diphospho)-2-C-methyl-D-erythritol kinase [Cetobacterium sp. 2A]